MHRSIALSALLGLAGCSSKPASQPAPVPAGPHALWSADPTSLANPFPDARVLGPDGGLAARESYWQPFVPQADADAGGVTFSGYMQEFAQSLGASPGFGNYGAQLVPFSSPVGAASLTGAFSFVRLTTPAVVEAMPTVAYDAELSYASVRPATPLLPATPYALVLSNAAQAAAGGALTRSLDFASWAGAAGQGQVASAAAALGLQPADIIFMNVFTTVDVRADMTALATWVAQPLPGGPALTVSPTPITTCSGGGDATIEQCPEGVLTVDGGVQQVLNPWLYDEGWEDPPVDVGTVVIGDVALQDVRDGENGHFVATYVAAPGTGRKVSRQFVMATPNPALHPMPAAGWPMVVAGHGLGGGNSVHQVSPGQPMPTFCLAMAEFLAQNGYGCLGIDAPSHQSRGSYFNYFNVQDLGVTRDYIREMVFDEMQLTRMLASWPPGLDGITIDPTNLRYVGQSLGSIEGAEILTLDPRLKGGVLLVPGGGLTDIVQSPILGSEVDVLIAAYSGVPFETLADGGLDPDFLAIFPVLLTVGQAVVESADPINHARFLPAGVHALIDEGLLDTIMPNPTTNALAAALGFPTLTAATESDAGVDGLWKWDLTKYGLDPTVDEPHYLFGYIPQARAQAGEYLGSFDTNVLAE
jgi:hypothetical protein